jgi:hypothetical protein
MSKKNREQQPQPQAQNKEEAKSKTLVQLQATFEKQPNKVLRMVNFFYARKLLGRPNLTWVEFCDEKIKAFTEHWEAKKTNPQAGKIKVLTPEQIAKKNTEVEKALAKIERLKAQLSAAQQNG